MTRRRIIALFLGLLLGHLTAGNAAPRCADRDDVAPAVSVAPESGHHHVPGDAGHPGVPGDTSRGAMQCCAAMASCAITLMGAGSRESTPLTDTGRDWRSFTAVAPARAPAAPEPPPPKR